ncbi:MAG: phosphatidate cytidylyltransferase [Helicobacteraceae bacterium]|jgi:phosphatidate cytidylyltransferase|nr:phosphatidate cytidylyltransferase [Helicobacteraceae bacterium]
MRLKQEAKRYQTALILLIVIAIIGIVHSPIIIGVFLTVVFVLASKEALNLYGFENSTKFWIALIAIWCVAIVYKNPLDILILAVIICASIAAYNHNIELKIALPLLYPAAPLMAMFLLYIEFGVLAIFWLLAIVIACDVGAYFAGRNIGKTPFSPSSPNKTIEGVAGGITAATIFGTILGIFMPNVAFASVILITIFVAIASVFGDLFESYLKRKAGVKDSGNLLPGHGGVLDRIDGYLFAGFALLILLRLNAYIATLMAAE